ncbi:MAG: GGDEF domain-containing phosphodiesterase [Betaproteobacteria bacterium]
MSLLQLPRTWRPGRATNARTPASTPANELQRDEFLRWLEGPVNEASGPGSAFALLVINLRRSDRTAALMHHPLAQAIDFETARRMSEALRPQDRFARLGAEHVVVVLPKVTDVAVVMLAVNRLFGNFEAPIDINGERVRIRPCAGCAFSLTNQVVRAQALLSAADGACAVARTSGSGFAIAPEMDGEAVDAGNMLDEFQDALRANELEVWFQPQRSVASGACVAAEALLRWHNRHRNRAISPALVVEMAEDYGMMTPLTTFVLNTSLRQLSDLQRAGIDVRVAVNVSASSLRDAELPELVARALATWSIPPDRLTIEVTESALMIDVERSLQVLRELKQLSVRLSIDDFGTGYSSLAYLRRMPLDELKIDQTFVKNMLENKADVQIVRSVIDLAHNFELEAVAEGVEDGATLDMLARLSCDVIQGYYYARPMPVAQMPAWWATREPDTA